jgi:catechol 2,3-dioxygenase-like lactoylglutathione lyase family enzyme
MKLGAFSVSLSVKDIHASVAFYQKLGFESFAGVIDNNWIIMKNGDTVIGLFQGMFPNNILTFNPGWNQSAENLEQFEDIRRIQKELEGQGMEFITKVKEDTSGPASFMVVDPDGNTILVDQHR